MPFYCFKTKDGYVHEKNFSIDKKIPAYIIVKGQRAYRDMPSEHNGFKNTPGNWPQLSDAAGVAPSQVMEAQAEMTKAGVPTDYTEDGRAIFRNRKHRKVALRAMGMYDRNAGFGDPEPINSK